MLASSCLWSLVNAGKLEAFPILASGLPSGPGDREVGAVLPPYPSRPFYRSALFLSRFLPPLERAGCAFRQV